MKKVIGIIVVVAIVVALVVVILSILSPSSGSGGKAAVVLPGKATVRGINLGMTAEEIIKVEEQRGNSEYDVRQSDDASTVWVTYKDIEVNDESADVRYKLENINAKNTTYVISIDFAPLEYTMLNEYMYEVESDPILSGRYIDGDFEWYSEIDPKLEQIVEKVNTTYSTTRDALINKYGAPSTCLTDGTSLSRSELVSTRYISARDGGDYGNDIINYAQWVCEYDDCVLTIELCFTRNTSIGTESYSCELDYCMYKDKSADEFKIVKNKHLSAEF